VKAKKKDNHSQNSRLGVAVAKYLRNIEKRAAVLIFDEKRGLMRRKRLQ